MVWFLFFFIKEPKFVKAEYDYKARKSDELSLNIGDVITLLEQGDKGWWKGSLNNKIGIFPANVSLSIKKSLFRHVSIINQIIIISFIVR